MIGRQVVETDNLTYIVQDEDGVVVAQGVSSSQSFVKHDAGGYHTKKRFDEMFPQGWHVNFDFEPPKLETEKEEI